MFKVLFADADNTLFDFSKCEATAIRQTLQAFDIDPTPETVAVYSAANDAQWKALERGETTQARLRVDRFTDFLSRMGLPTDMDVSLNNDYVQRLGQQRFLMPGALDFCRKVSGQMPIWLVTNGVAVIQRSRFGQSELAPYIAGYVISEEVGAAKPNPAMIYKALELSGTKKEEAVMLGDSLTADIAAAVNAGIASIWFTNGKAPREGHPATWAATTLDEAAQIIMQ